MVTMALDTPQYQLSTHREKEKLEVEHLHSLSLEQMMASLWVSYKNRFNHYL